MHIPVPGLIPRLAYFWPRKHLCLGTPPLDNLAKDTVCVFTVVGAFLTGGQCNGGHVATWYLPAFMYTPC